MKEVTAEDYLRQTSAFDPVTQQEAIEVVPQVKPVEMDIEQFMNETVTILVHESTDPNATRYAEVSVNGRRLFIERGTPTLVKRMYVERLARAKKITYMQDLDPRLGEDMNRLRAHRGFDYPFSVTEDVNPRGAEWLKRVLAEA